MTDLRKAAEMTLEALEEINKLSIGENAICLPAEIDGAMEALRQALAQPEQEPVSYQDTMDKCRLEIVPAKGTLLNTAPPKREWVGLTYEEARAIRLKVGSAADEYAVAIEEALKEKNT